MPIELKKPSVSGKKIVRPVEVEGEEGEKVELIPSSKELKGLRELPTSPGTNVSYEVMIQWLQGLTEHQLDRIGIQTYRSYPKVIAPQGEGYIDATLGKDWNTELSEASLLAKHGSGNYMFFVRDDDKRGLLFKAKVSFPLDVNNPPKVNPEIVDQSPDGLKLNKAYFNWLAANNMDISGKKINQPVEKDSKGDLTDKLVNDLLSERKRLADNANIIPSLLTTVQSANQAVIGMVTDQAKSMVEKMTDMNQRGGGADGQIYTLMMKQLEASEARAAKLEEKVFQLIMMKENTPSPTPPPVKTLAEQIKELKELKEVTNLFKGGGSATEEKGIVATLLTELAPAINTGLQLAGQYVLQKMNPNMPIPSTMTNVSAEGLINPLMQQNPLLPQQPAMQTQPTQPTEQNQQQQIINHIISNLEQYHVQIGGAMRLMSGDTFADKAEAWNPTLILELSKIDPKIMYQIIQNAPTLWASVKDLGEAKIMEWLTEFHEWGNENPVVETSEEEEEEGEEK